MRTYRMVPVAGLVLVVGAWIPRPTAGQVGTEVATEGYLTVVADHFEVPRREVALLTEGALGADELPVLLRISQSSGIAPTAILAQRRGGAGWSAVAARYGLGSSLFHVRIPADQAGGILGRALRAFAETPPGAIDGVSLSDTEIVAFENVRVLTSALGIQPDEVLRVREQTSSFVDVYGRLRGAR